MLEKRKKDQRDSGWVDRDAEKAPGPRRPARGPGQWAPRPAMLSLSPGDPGRPVNLSRPGSLLGEMALAVHGLWAALFLEFSGTLTAGSFYLLCPPSLCSAGGSARSLFPSCGPRTPARPPDPSGDTTSSGRAPDAPTLDCLPCSAHCPCPLPRALNLSCSEECRQCLGQGLAYSRRLINE